MHATMDKQPTRQTIQHYTCNLGWIIATKIKWANKHIKGHQNEVALVALSNKARWNDGMDQAAK